MNVNHGVVNTINLPFTKSILKSSIPSIFMSSCYNDNNIPFEQEVLRTETGHLLEHVIIEYLYLMKKEKMTSNPVHRGVTSWNWIEEDWGTFNIEIDCGIEDERLMQKAIRFGVDIVEQIIGDQKKETKRLTANVNTRDMHKLTPIEKSTGI